MMQNSAAGDSTGLYVEQILALCCELEAAMGAIASNSLEALEESIARQELLCADLGCAPRGWNTTSVESQYAVEIHEVSAAIRHLNLAYDVLLKRSGKSAALLSALCRSHISRADGGTGWRQQTWSCEV